MFSFPISRGFEKALDLRTELIFKLIMFCAENAPDTLGAELFTLVKTPSCKVFDNKNIRDQFVALDALLLGKLPRRLVETWSLLLTTISTKYSPKTNVLPKDVQTQFENLHAEFLAIAMPKKRVKSSESPHAEAAEEVGVTGDGPLDPVDDGGAGSLMFLL